MTRAWAGVVAVLMAVGLSGCCAGPKRFYQNAYGFNCPETEQYKPGPPPPVTTPPGFTTPAVLPPPPDVAQ